MEVLAIVGSLVSLIGALFLFLAAIGIIRMPDTYNRMQTGTKATTLGSLLFFIGIALAHPSWWTKLLVLTLFVFLTNPLSSHVLARALHFIGKSPLVPEYSGTSVRDDLAYDELSSKVQADGNLGSTT